MVEHVTRNDEIVGSIPTAGFKNRSNYSPLPGQKVPRTRRRKEKENLG